MCKSPYLANKGYWSCLTLALKLLKYSYNSICWNKLCIIKNITWQFCLLIQCNTGVSYRCNNALRYKHYFYSSVSYLKHLAVLLLQNPIKINTLLMFKAHQSAISLFTSSVIIIPYACLGGKKLIHKRVFFLCKFMKLLLIYINFVKLLLIYNLFT